MSRFHRVSSLKTPPSPLLLSSYIHFISSLPPPPPSPQRLSLAFMVDTPFIFNMFWTAIKPFINSKTRSKIHFVSGDLSQKSKLFSQYFDLDMLERDYGGKSEHAFDKEKYWQREIEE